MDERKREKKSLNSPTPRLQCRSQLIDERKREKEEEEEGGGGGGERGTRWSFTFCDSGSVGANYNLQFALKITKEW